MAPKKRKLVRDSDDDSASKKTKVPPPATTMRITRNMKTDGPRQAVFNTAELLEGILLELPMKQLFVIRRVSKQFRDGVNTSVKLQVKMFLRPSGRKVEKWAVRTTQLYPNDFPEYLQTFEFVRSSELVTNKVKSADDLLPVKLNPLLDSTESIAVRTQARHVIHAEGEHLRVNLTRFLKCPGTWRDMYLTDPPCNAAIFSFSTALNTDPPTTVYFASKLEAAISNGMKLRTVIKTTLKSCNDLRIRRYGVGNEVRSASVKSIVSKMSPKKKKKNGPIFKSAIVEITLTGVVVPAEEEWGAVRRRSDAARFEEA